jgi:hypothetical protein
MKLTRFKVGDAVRVKALLTRVKGPRQAGGIYTAHWERHPCDRIGVIVGAGRRYDGERDPGGSYGSSPWSEEPPDIDPPSFVSTKTHMVWKVRFGLTNKTGDVLDADVEPYDEPFDLPIQAGAWEWGERDKQMMRDEMVSWPRDKSGRWVKKEDRA